MFTGISFLFSSTKGHVDKGQAYAEIEVMKMVMTLTVNEAGTVSYVKRPGAVLEPGSVLANLDLDDASLVTKAVLYKGPFPELDVSVPMRSDKLNHIHAGYRAVLENTLAGYCLPEPYHSARLREIIENFMASLRDPSLPLLELQEVMASVQGRIHNRVEKPIRQLMLQYEKNITSVLSQFPSQEVSGRSVTRLGAWLIWYTP